MYYREVYILRPELQTVAAATRTLDINITDPISKISVTWKKKNTNSTSLGHPGSIVKNILVCDGADVLYSMNGSHAQSMAYYTENTQPACILNYVTGEYSVQMAEIKFGRWLYDEMLALDPKRFNNLQIKIEWDDTLGGCTGDHPYFSVYAHCFDEKVVEPIGWLYNKEIYSFIPVAGGWRYIDLPTDYPIRAIMFGCENEYDAPNFVFAEMRLTEDQGKHVLIESELHRYMQETTAYYHPWNEMVYALPTGSNADMTIHVTPHFERQSHLMPTAVAEGFRHQSAAGFTQIVATETTAQIIKGEVMGHCPFGAMWLKTYGGQDIEDCWQINYTGSGRLELRTCTGITTRTVEYQKVYTQQVRTY